MKTALAGLFQCGQPQRRLADIRFTLDEQAGRLIAHRRDEVSYRAEFRRTTDKLSWTRPNDDSQQTIAE